MIHRLFIALCLAVSAYAAEYSIPSSRTPAAGAWEAAGVPGGIYQYLPGGVNARTTVSSALSPSGNTDDRSTDIWNATQAASATQVVYLNAGVYYLSGGVPIGYNKDNITLRGAVNPDGSPAVKFMMTGGTYAVQIGTNNLTYLSPVSGVVASFTKGATTLEVADSSSFSNGQLVKIVKANEATTPVFAVNAAEGRRVQYARLKTSGGVPDGTHIALDSPGLYGDWTDATGIEIYGIDNNFLGPLATGVGVENIEIDWSLHPGVGPFNSFNLDTAYGSWFYNCKSSLPENYGVYVTQAINCEVRRNYLLGEDNGSSTAAVLLSASSSVLVIDNVMQNGSFGVYQQEENSANVIAYNFLTDDESPWITLNVNHGPWNQFTCVEGNVGLFVQNDGYFGGTGYGTYFRNWFMGTPLADPTPVISLGFNRSSRYENVVGNVFGRTGVGGGLRSFGNPNFNNGNSSGTISMRGAASTLTTRTNASSGTITAPSGHGVTTGATIDVYWNQFDSPYYIAKIRYGMTVGTVSGTSIPVSGGDGDDLPSQSATLYVPTSNAALYSYSLDWNSSTGGPRIWAGDLTTRTSGTEGQVTLDPGQTATFNAALANTASSGYTNQRGLRWASGIINAVTVTSVVGDVVTFENASNTLPAISTPVEFVPSYPGFQELDLDVIYTTLLRANYLGFSSGSGIPSFESIGSDTLADSMFLSGTPQFFTDAGLAWPPIDPFSPVTNDYEIIPAGMAYVNGWWPSNTPTGTQATVTGTTTVTGTLTLP